MEDSDSTVQDNQRMDNVAKLAYDCDARLQVSKNRYRPTIQYGLMPKASTNIKGVSE